MARQITSTKDAALQIERTRQLILSDTNIRTQLQIRQPELVESALNDPTEFSRLMEYHTQMFMTQKERLASFRDPFDPIVQQRIEEMIREQRVAENMAHAMEYHPESFGSVTMLYVNCRVNGSPLKAFVDCGAQTTIMTLVCARRVGLEELIDRRFSGIAKGVGTGQIVGRVHLVQLQLGGQFLPSSITVIDGSGPDMLFGLDMLKRHQCTIDFGESLLIVNGEKLCFLPESEIPKDLESPS